MLKCFLSLIISDSYIIININKRSSASYDFVAWTHTREVNHSLYCFAWPKIWAKFLLPTVIDLPTLFSWPILLDQRLFFSHIYYFNVNFHRYIINSLSSSNKKLQNGCNLENIKRGNLSKISVLELKLPKNKRWPLHYCWQNRSDWGVLEIFYGFYLKTLF